nr:M20 family metallopeptidase [uncultured Blautia sp.]
MSKVTKAEILERAKGQLDDLVELVSQLIKIPSENPIGSQRPVIDFVEKYLEDAGIDWEEVGCNEDFPCIVAHMGKEDGFSVILNGHVDVVPAGDREQWDFDPFSGAITEKEILGRGTSDMKAGVAGFLFAMKVLKESGAQLNGNIRLHIVSDEESGGEFGTKWLCDNGYAENADACLVGEPTSHDNIEIGQKGKAELIFKSHGVSAHGSLAGYKGENAILKLFRVLDHLEDLRKIEGHYGENQKQALINSKLIAGQKNGAGTGEVIDHVAVNVGMIHGGVRPNMVPDYCEAVLDVRLPIGVDEQEIRDCVDNIVKKSQVEGIEYTLDFQSFGNYTEIDAAIVEAIKKHAEELWNIEVLPAYQWASSDAREYREKGIPTIQYGPSNTVGIHSYNETVDIEDVKNAGQIYILSLCDLMGIQ